MRSRSIALAAKRVMDVAGAAAGLLLLAPVLGWISIALLATQGRPILFRQERPGLHGKLFTMTKFRTMRPPTAGEDVYLTDRQRMTRIGRFLRATSLDELPELWNVLRGDMSLVGPRPLLPEYLASYSAEENRRHDMRPGVTGWAVVNGRTELAFKDRFALDVWYVDHWSLSLDFRTLALTAGQVLRRQHVNVDAEPVLGFPTPGTSHAADATGEGLDGATRSGL